jgi:hypothetical protein
LAAVHELTATVFPQPAGAITSVIGPCTPALSRLSSRGRITTDRANVGIRNFADMTGFPSDVAALA